MSRKWCDTLVAEDLVSFVLYQGVQHFQSYLYSGRPTIVNTVLKRDFGLQTEEVTVPRNLLTDRYSSPNVISVIK